MPYWKKLGKIFDPTQTDAGNWFKEYAQCPTPVLLNENVVRVYIATRPPRGTDLQYVSYPSYVDLDRNNLTDVIGTAKKPLLHLGSAGSFDEFGIMPSSVVFHGGDMYMYYTGWTRMSSVPYTVNIGAAVSHDGGNTFEKIAEGPVLGLTFREPYLVNSPTVKIIDGVWHMWYMTGIKWLPNDGKPESDFRIAHATSLDGLAWERDGKLIIPTVLEDECQDIFMPVWRDGKWHAIFGYRRALGFRTEDSSMYRLGYASSIDLIHWERDDTKVGLFPVDSEWDSQMQCSSQLIEIDGRLLLFYCGNHFGREGFGIAEWEP
jgi:predicted GH43/DUF377 family glycosyl hydrolase